MANTKEFNISSNAVTVLNQTAEATNNARKELKELQKQMLSMDADSVEFQKAAARAGELKDQMNDAADAIRTSTGPALESMNNTFSIMSGQIANLDFGGLGQSFTSLGRAVEKINIKTLKDELGGLVKGFGNLAGAIISNPILAIGGAVALLVLNFDKINAALNGTAEKVEKLGKANEALEKQNLILDNRIAKEKTLYGESFKTLNLEKEKAQNNIKVAENELTIAKRTGDINVIREKENKLIEMRNLLSGITAKGEADRVKLVEEAKNITIDGYKEEQDRQAAIAKFEDARQEQLSVIAKKQQEIYTQIQIDKMKSGQWLELKEKKDILDLKNQEKRLIISNEEYQLQQELAKLKEEEQILRNAKFAITTGTTVNELKAKELALQKELNKEGKTAEQLQEEVEKQLEANAIAAAKELEFEQHLVDEKTRIHEEYALANMGEQAKELYELEKKKEKELQTWEGAEEDKIWIEDKYRVLELQLNKKYDDALLEQKQETNDKEKQQAEDLAKAKLEAEKQLYEARWALATASVDLLGTIFQKNKRAADIAFALDKGLAVAKVVVDTQAEIAGYYAANAAAGPVGMAIASSQALAAKIRAATSIATIAAASVGKFMAGSGSAASSLSGGGGSAGTNAPTPANFSFLANQPNQQQPPLQAYVVSGQVSSNIEAQQLINNQSRLGG